MFTVSRNSSGRKREQRWVPVEPAEAGEHALPPHILLQHRFHPRFQVPGTLAAFRQHAAVRVRLEERDSEDCRFRQGEFPFVVVFG